MKNEVVSKTLVSATIFLLISVIITPIITGNNFKDDTTPPITTHTLNPPTPDGENGWYVSDVTVTLNATDDISGVKEIKYRVDGGITHTIVGDNGTFILDKDKDNLPIEYWAIDNTENEETHHIFYIDIDQTKPEIYFDLDLELYDEENDIYQCKYNVTATDETSKMNRTEFYLNGILYKTVYGLGPTYIWELILDYSYFIWGRIFKRTITDDYIRFFAIFVTVEYGVGGGMDYSVYAYDNAGNSEYDSIIDLPDYEDVELKWFTFSNNYVGYIGNFYINARFEKYPISITPFTNVLNFEINPVFLRFLERFPLLNLLLQRLTLL